MPVIPANLPPHMLAVGVGAFKPDMAEFPAELLHARSIVVDHLAGARHEAGDLLRAQIDWSRVRELASVVTEGIRQDGAPPLFKTVGHAAWDLAASRVALAAT
jgi:1-piperideine-2-carboxylate/1-pyrroline-2-carboxylate reductase [NAD(P)H]